MTEFDEVLPGEAAAIIDEYGATLALITKTNGAYNKTTGKFDVVDAPPKIVKCIFDEATQGKRKFYVAAMTLDFVNPTSVDAVVSEGKTYTTFEVETIKSGELDCLYIVSVER